MWTKLDTKIVTLFPLEEAPPAGWTKLDTRTITLTPKAPPIPPEEEKKFPWAPVAIGAGAVVAILGLLSAAKRR